MQHKEPLYRRENTRTRGVHHGGSDYRFSRHLKKQDKTSLGSMHGKKQHGLDYTPLFRFLLSKVGQDWSDVHSEAVARLDRPEPIFWIVATNEADKKPVARAGENSYYSGLYVDQDNRLALVDPELRLEEMRPSCSCCTQTLNGVPFTRKYEAL
ncbi:hypothetical protein NKI77_26215 [Mesorhizobium opportunistum]|uniref:Uncharacterized protein n=1 Tax=Mesorhizobium opportunistum TaxID=593909 RepID=A0ABV1YM73_9HYPH|nr:hypothetical protein [Mesorhizobium sp.]TIN97582.1 MAG: hypothetical protein E5Y06_04905 [Mesorhizobium sp.]TJU98844.1 MAG: hypothetical protein E5Y08_11975 [Mesorhizobium sp.]TJV13114.1 MAG: hypothetical protein E5Y07_33120 [Mesorhizobium sp.]